MSSPSQRPNILFVMTDQQSYKMMSCAGNTYLRTPAMDRIARQGVRFDRAYATNPVCVPSRFSLFTGRMPSEVGMISNSSKHLEEIPERIRRKGMGWLLKDAGYKADFAGKQHLPKMRAEDLGFDVVCRDERDGLAQACEEYLQADHDKPFALVASFINPHDICYMAIRDHVKSDFEKILVEKGKKEIAELDEALKRPEGVDDETFWNELCPPLPENFQPQEAEPEAIAYLGQERQFRGNARDTWSQEQWRLHRWAYHRLTQRVDGQIGRVMEALEASRYADNTIVIFTSDHGDHDGSHKLEHKDCLYDEAARIPFIVSAPGGPQGKVDTTHMVSNGLDLLPTICDYAGAEIPEDLLGRSIRPLLEQGDNAPWREHLQLESQVGFGVVQQRYKYVMCHFGKNAEQLYDLELDPFETRNFADDPDHAEALEKMRMAYQEYCWIDVEQPA